MAITIAFGLRPGTNILMVIATSNKGIAKTAMGMAITISAID